MMPRLPLPTQLRKPSNPSKQSQHPAPPLPPHPPTSSSNLKSVRSFRRKDTFPLARLPPPPPPLPVHQSRIDRLVFLDTPTAHSHYKPLNIMVPPVSVTVRAAETPVSPSSSRKAVKASATASAPSSRPPTTRSDPFYGHEETAVLCARFVSHSSSH
ncbi:hypothetical protein BD324DRAFT_457315 [Kockovaella imperatae]|uniref:Uncharacterized protein n=1 Tax=Kockovaella imperatae TaxID=4999 RepID=A0A1Y1UEX1_9TREE|nr:hypothetical protein BD324DRAFT_457315 [Kockovaella imperatae]ORX36621.1 hypothetical protein BD324DRAFT_457315 [Kockovaella imperatae]